MISAGEPEHGIWCGGAGKLVTVCDVSRYVLISQLAQDKFYFGRHSQGLQIVQPRVRAQNGGPRMLAQRLIADMKKVRNISNFLFLFLVPSLRPVEGTIPPS